MSLMDALAIEPFSVNEPLIDALLLEPDMQEVYLVNTGTGGMGSGTIGDPYQVPTAAAFDSLMSGSQILANATIHLGPGDFLTNGFGAAGWTPKAGWRFVGAGADVTTLRLDGGGTYVADKEYFVIGGADTDLANGFEIQDLTLDANLPNISVNIAASGIKVFGSGIRIHHIRVINFGTKTTQFPARAIVTAGAYPTNPEPFDCVVEDCEIDRPFRNSVRESHCIVLAGGEGSTDGFMAYHKGCVVRNCYVDCYYSNKETAVKSVTIDTIDNTKALVETTVAHQLGVDGWFVLSRALEQSAASTRFNGSFKVTDVVSATQFKFKYHLPTTTIEPTGEMYVGRVASHRVVIQSLQQDGSQWIVETTTPHYRLPAFQAQGSPTPPATPAENIMLTNVRKSDGTLSNDFNKSFDVHSVIDPFKLRITLTTSETLAATQTDAYIGVDFYGITTAGGRGVIVEGNRLHSVTFGYYHKEFSTFDVAIRDNHFLDVLAAVYGKLGQVSGGDVNQQPQRAGAALNATGTVAEFTTVDPHGLAKGDVVLVANASIAAYNGMFKIDSITSPKRFKYTTLSAPGGSATGMEFGALWRVGRWMIENNAVDLIGTITPGFDPPTAIRLERTASNPVAPASPYVFGQIVVIANVIRMIENAFDSTTYPVGIKLNNCEQAIVEDNVIKLNRATPIEFIACGTIKFFNNQSPSGKLLQGYDVTNSKFMNELETDVDLAAVSVM